MSTSTGKRTSLTLLRINTRKSMILKFKAKYRDIGCFWTFSRRSVDFTAKLLLYTWTPILRTDQRWCSYSRKESVKREIVNCVSHRFNIHHLKFSIMKIESSCKPKFEFLFCGTIKRNLTQKEVDTDLCFPFSLAEMWFTVASEQTQMTLILGTTLLYWSNSIKSAFHCNCPLDVFRTWDL